MIRSILVIIAFLFFHGTDSVAGIVVGNLNNNEGEELSYASVYVKNTTYGVSSNLKGEYAIELVPGTYTLVYSYIGYTTVEKEISIEGEETIKLDVVLLKEHNLLDVVEIVANTRDLANEIVSNSRAKRSSYLRKVKTYQCKTYIKTSLEKEDKTRFDSLKLVVSPSSFIDHLKKEKMNLIESVSDHYFEYPNKRKEVIIAHHDYSEMKEPTNVGVTVEAEYGSRDIASHTYLRTNPYIIYENILSGDYNFYKNNMTLKKVSEKPILSPIASTSSISYVYDYGGSFVEDGMKVHRIKVKPRFSKDALFNGTIFIQDSTWALVSVDLKVNKSVLSYCTDFNIIQNYTFMDNDIVIPTRRILDYTIKDGKNYILGSASINFSEYQVNIDFPPKTFSNEIIQYEIDAFDKEESYWEDIRPLRMKTKELDFIHTADSIKMYFDSDIYKLKRDSIYNNLNIWSFLFNGVGYRNSFTGHDYYFDPLIAQIVPFGIGGYRHRLGASYRRTYDSGKNISFRPKIDYGFNNKDLKGSIGMSYTYLPLKFARTSIRIGNTYELINTYESFSALFARANYVNSKDISVSQRLELFNGMYGELSISYGDKIPIVDLELSEWSKQLFGVDNEPSEFERYKKFEIRLHLQYRINQKYMIKKNRKIILETKYPELSLIYRKGINGVFGSEVDFDYLELKAKANVKLGRWGSSRWEILSGNFINKKNLRLLEYKFFRGSDPFLFSDPLNSFQLLGTTFNTANTFLRGSYLHHFNGVILNKVPLINKLKISLAAGISTLYIEDKNFRHGEAFVGIERVFRIKKELFRFGIYGVTGDDNYSKPKLTYKLGVSFYNSYLGEWSF